MVTSVLLGLLLVVGVAVVVIVLVSLPHLRDGASLMTAAGERRADDPRRPTGGAPGGQGGPSGQATPSRPPRQVASAAATPAPGTPKVAGQSSARSGSAAAEPPR